MRTLQKYLKYLGLVVLIILLFRGVLFRVFFVYKPIHTRTLIPLEHTELTDLLRESRPQTLESIITLSESIICERLSFSSIRQSQNSNTAYERGTAHCVGYTALFSTIVQYLLEQNRLNDQYQVNHTVGQLFLLGINIHDYWNAPFFSDHDYTIIINKHSHEKVAIDLTVSDYLGIHRITTE